MWEVVAVGAEEKLVAKARQDTSSNGTHPVDLE